MSKDKDREKLNFIHSSGTGNLDEGENEPFKQQWTDSISVAPTKYTLDKKKKKKGH